MRTFGAPWALIGAVAVLLAGCGFRPLYARGETDGASVNRHLAATTIELIADRQGQQLRNFLLDAMNPRGEPLRPRYRLTISLGESLQELALRRDETATRARVIMTAAFKLEGYANGEPLHQGNSRVVSSYNILAAHYATLEARENARRLAVEQISSDIKTRLAVFFSRAPGA